MTKPRAATVLVVAAVWLAGCNGSDDRTQAWCESFERAGRAFTELQSSIPEGTDPNEATADPQLQEQAERAGERMQELRSAEPPEEIADDVEVLFTSLPPELGGTGGSVDRQRYDEALTDVEEFLSDECGIDDSELFGN
ncbi:MAG: hypothetical protein ACRDKZ_00830 [Actinomycetota bacterium]